MPCTASVLCVWPLYAVVFNRKRVSTYRVTVSAAAYAFPVSIHRHSTSIFHMHRDVAMLRVYSIHTAIGKTQHVVVQPQIICDTSGKNFGVRAFRVSGTTLHSGCGMQRQGFERSCIGGDRQTQCGTFEFEREHVCKLFFFKLKARKKLVF